MERRCVRCRFHARRPEFFRIAAETRPSHLAGGARTGAATAGVGTAARCAVGLFAVLRQPGAGAGRSRHALAPGPAACGADIQSAPRAGSARSAEPGCRLECRRRAGGVACGKPHCHGRCRAVGPATSARLGCAAQVRRATNPAAAAGATTTLLILLRSAAPRLVVAPPLLPAVAGKPN